VGSFIYTPQIRVLVEAGGNYYRKDTSPRTYDVSADLVSGTMNRRVDGVSDFNFTLLNPRRKYDQIFTPNDRITVLMKRVEWVRVFTGYLNKVPLMTAWPRNVSLTASCSLKRLQYWYWDPESAYTQQMIMNALSAARGSGVNTDGGMTNVVLSVLNNVVGWPNSKVHIAKIPDDWFAVAQKIAAAVEKGALESDALAKQFFQSLGSSGVIGGTQGDSTAGTGNVGGTLGTAQIGEFGTVALRNAEKIFAQGSSMSATTSDQIVALMTAMQETHLGEDPRTNIPNEYDAVGVFQQRYKLSEWGGSLQSCLDVQQSAKRFFEHLFKMIPSRATMAKGQQANTVQRAGADQTVNFQKWEGAATTLVNKIQGKTASTTADTANTGKAPGSTTSVGNATNLQMIQGAKDFVASYPSIPYTQKYGGTQMAVLAATPPPGLDCSSFVQAVVLRVLGGLYDFQHARVVSEQRTVCRIIDVATALKTPGALLFNGNEHVEMSIGDGKHSVGAHHTGTVASVQGTSASYWTDGGLIPRVSYGPLGTGDGTATGGTTDGTGATGAATKRVYNDAYSSMPGYNPNDPFDRLFGDTVWQPLVSQETSEAYALSQSLTGIKSLLNDQPLLPYLKNLFSATMRSFSSAPNGDLIAWFPDYYGLWGTAAKMVVQPIEVKDFSVDWDDSYFVTHQFTATTPSGGAGQNGLDLSTGQVSPLVSSVTDPLVIAQNLAYTRGIASIDIPAMMYAMFKVSATDAQAKSFAAWIYKRFGARPDFQQLPNLVGPSAEFFASIYFFMRQWAYQYNADIPLTFMPELYPGMLIQIPAFSFQGYVNSVTHSFQFGKDGYFSTQVNISAPARLSESGNAADVLIGLPSAGDFKGA
jgi:cell wall-associated NlpC family hydrolase